MPVEVDEFPLQFSGGRGCRAAIEPRVRIKRGTRDENLIAGPPKGPGPTDRGRKWEKTSPCHLPSSGGGPPIVRHKPEWAGTVGWPLACQKPYIMGTGGFRWGKHRETQSPRRKSWETRDEIAAAWPGRLPTCPPVRRPRGAEIPDVSPGRGALFCNHHSHSQQQGAGPGPGRAPCCLATAKKQSRPALLPES